MATEVFDDAIDLQIGLLQAGTASIRVRDAAYPYPRLEPLAEQEMRRFRTVVLENQYLRVTVIPALGGRIIGIFDKRTSTEILKRYPAVEPQEGGPRGAYVREGVQLRLGPDDRPNSLGNVDTAIEDDAVWVAESAAGSGISFHLRISLPSDSAVIRLDGRAFNRSLRSVPYNGGIALHLGDGQLLASNDGTGFWGRNAGLAILWPEQVFDGIALSEGALAVSRWTGLADLAPRQLDSFSFTLVPISGIGGLSAFGEAGAITLTEKSVRLQATREMLGHRLLLAIENGDTMEASVDLYPERAMELPLNGLRPTALVLRSPAHEDLLRWPRLERSDEPIRSEPPRTTVTISRKSSEADLRRATLDVSQRAIANTLLGYRHLGEGRYSDAAVDFEQALLFNAEDHLTWWAKAIAERLADSDAEDRPELPNAHFLAPLEPALRAEAFLAQGVTGKEPSPIVAPLAENPENLIEVAALLIEAGLFSEASRWIDEALRHRDLAMLHLLQAYVLSKGTRMAVEAAQHLRAADLSTPPLPYRDIEWEAIQDVLGPEA